jgi:hypothetical protein
MTTFNERTSLRVTARLRSGSDPISPTTLHYKLINLSRNETVIDWTALTPSADASVDIDARLLNVIGRKPEEFEITFAGDKDTDDQVTKELTWWLKNRRAFD